MKNKINLYILLIALLISTSISSMTLERKEFVESSHELLLYLPEEILLYIIKIMIKEIIYNNDIFTYLIKLKETLQSIYLINSKFKNLISSSLIKFAKQKAYARFNIQPIHTQEFTNQLIQMLILKNCPENEIEVAKLVIAGVNPNLEIKYNNECLSLILFIIKYSELKKLVNLLIIKGANLNKKDKYGNDALILATLKGDEDIVHLLIKAGINLNVENNLKQTALTLSIGYGFLPITKLILNYSNHIDQTFLNKALILCSKIKNLEILKLLANKIKEINQQ
ncbi:ankyrin repeat domain-containing protein [Candidatus Babela massiliensis]|uniref:Ankyrin repeats containing protein n=1 Tax=Candidatus Babela massiliensis TaxID=673862 RepID=V6DH61_9BACT|nr:ankyrin repeat domain-containing protein [Candidatus Babela massiliensis]CDK30932.1 Ankyrin repeats containing protein [Candidatus Babela massiliensis]